MPRARRRRKLIESAALVRDDSRFAELLVDRRAARGIHHGDDDAVRRRQDARLGERPVVGPRYSDAAAAADHRAGLDPRRAHADACAGARRHAGRRAGVTRHRLGRGIGIRRAAAPRSSARARGRCSAPSCRCAGRHAARARSEFHERRRRLRDDAAAEEYRRALAAAGVPRDRGRPTATNTATTGCLSAARDHERPFQSLFDPDHRGFFQPPDMVSSDFGLLPADRPARARFAGGVRARNPGEPGVQVPRRASMRSSR